MTGPVDEGSVLLHIGPQKTGSTAVQMALHRARPVLAEHGVLYPGPRACDHEAGWAVMGLDGTGGRRRQPRIARWDALVDQLRSTRLPRSCLSIEGLARADAAAVERILDGTGRDRTHVVYTARRLDTLVRSHWQQRLKSGLRTSYEDFLREAVDDHRASWERDLLWQSQDVGAVIDRWVARVGPERFTVVVLDDEPDRLLRAFEALLALPSGLLETPPTHRHQGMSHPQAEVVRRLNQLSAAEGWSARRYARVIQSGVVKSLRRADSSGPRISGLPAWAAPAVAERSRRQVDAIRTSGVRVVGDPARLLVDEHDVVSADAIPPPVDRVGLDLVEQAVLGAVAGMESLHRSELTRLRKRTRAAASDPSGRELLAALAARVRGRRPGRRPGRR